MKKKWFVIGFALCLVLLLPITARAADIVASGTCGENLTWTLDSDGTLIVSGTGAMTGWNSYSFRAPWYSRRSSITSVVIENGVTIIGKYAYDGCDALTSVTIPDSLTSIRGNAFSKCSNLTSIVIPNSVTEIGSDAFFGCASLTSVTIPSSVTTIGVGAFDCTKLTAITVDIDNSKYMDVDGVLFNRSGTLLHTFPAGKNETTYIVPDGVEYIEQQAFSDCVYLNSITVSKSVMQIGIWAFADSKKLVSVFIPDSVKSIGENAFENCINLTNVTIPNGITSIGEYTFSGCASLNNVTISDSVTSIGNCAFYNCVSLTSVTIPDSVTSIGRGVFRGCNNLNSAGPIGSGCDYEFGWMTSIPSNAFDGCSSLTSITIPNSVAIIENNAFSRPCLINGQCAQGRGIFSSDKAI